MSDQTVIIDSYWGAFKKWRISNRKPIVEILNCPANRRSQERVLSILLEELERNNQVYNKNQNNDYQKTTIAQEERTPTLFSH